MGPSVRVYIPRISLCPRLVRTVFLSNNCFCWFCWIYVLPHSTKILLLILMPSTSENTSIICHIVYCLLVVHTSMETCKGEEGLIKTMDTPLPLKFKSWFFLVNTLVVLHLIKFFVKQFQFLTNLFDQNSAGHLHFLCFTTDQFEITRSALIRLCSNVSTPIYSILFKYSKFSLYNTSLVKYLWTLFHTISVKFQARWPNLGCVF